MVKRTANAAPATGSDEWRFHTDHWTKTREGGNGAKNHKSRALPRRITSPARRSDVSPQHCPRPEREAYEVLRHHETIRTIRWQKEADLDVLVQGKLERSEMVQYFGEQLSGFTFTKHI